jgi:hypothetical protein
MAGGLQDSGSGECVHAELSSWAATVLFSSPAATPDSTEHCWPGPTKKGSRPVHGRGQGYTFFLLLYTMLYYSWQRKQFMTPGTTLFCNRKTAWLDATNCTL